MFSVFMITTLTLSIELATCSCNRIYTILDSVSDSLSNNKRTKDIKASPKDQSNVTYDDAVYELPDSECTKQSQAEPGISTEQEASTYVSLKNSKEPENVYQSLQPKKDNIAAVEYENRVFTY